MRIHTKTLLAAGAALFAIQAADAATIGIDGRLADALVGGLEWSFPAANNDNEAIPDATDSDGDVILTVSANGRRWNDGFSVGDYTPGQGWNFRAEDFGNTGDLAITNGQYIEITLDSTGLDSDVFDLDAVSVSLWRNGNGAPTDYALAFDADNNGWDTGDFLITATPAAPEGGVINPETLTFDASTIDAATTSSTIRLYYWGSISGSGNTHLYDVELSYTIIPEPGSLALLGLGGLCMIMRRRRD